MDSKISYFLLSKKNEILSKDGTYSNMCYTIKNNLSTCDFSRLRLLVKGLDQTKIFSISDFIHQIESIMGLKLTKTEITIKESGFYFEANRRWIVSPVMLDLYCLLVRSGMTHVIGEKCKDTMNHFAYDPVLNDVEDSCTWTLCLPVIEFMLKNDKFLFWTSRLDKNKNLVESFTASLNKNYVVKNLNNCNLRVFCNENISKLI